MPRSFRIKRPGVPAQSEHKLQVALMDYLAFAGRKDLHWFAIPNQSNRHIANAAKMKAEGVRAGTPDICFVLDAGRVAWLEMKTATGRLSASQEWFRDMAIRLGHHWALARSVDEAIGFLREWNVLKPGDRDLYKTWTETSVHGVRLAQSEAA